MILECPSCQARFNVADSAIPAAGRMVRCSRCSKQWHVDKDSAAAPHVVKPAPAAPVETDIIAEMMAETPPQPTIVEELSPEAKVEGEAFMNQLEAVISATEAKMGTKAAPKRTTPISTRKPRNVKPFKMAVPAIAATWLVLAFITYFPKWLEMPVLSGVYSAFGVKVTDGLVFSDVTMQREREGSKTKFILSGSIRNQTNTTREVPTVRVKLRDKNNNSLWGREYPGEGKELKAGEVFPFRIKNVETVFASSVDVIEVDMGNKLQLLVR